MKKGYFLDIYVHLRLFVDAPLLFLPGFVQPRGRPNIGRLALLLSGGKTKDQRTGQTDQIVKARQFERRQRMRVP